MLNNFCGKVSYVIRMEYCTHASVQVYILVSSIYILVHVLVYYTSLQYTSLQFTSLYISLVEYTRLFTNLYPSLYPSLYTSAQQI